MRADPYGTLTLHFLKIRNREFGQHQYAHLHFRGLKRPSIWNITDAISLFTIIIGKDFHNIHREPELRGPDVEGRS